MRILSFDIGIKNLAHAFIEVPDAAQGASTTIDMQILSWDVWDVSAIASGTESQMVAIGQTIYAKLDEFLAANEPAPTVVLLELQPVLKNPTMKSIQMILFGYFLGRKHWEGLVDQIHFVNACQKLKGYPELPAKMTYAEKKKAAIKLTRAAIRELDPLIEVFDKHGKKDDLADTVCQAAAWLQPKNKNRAFSLALSTPHE